MPDRLAMQAAIKRATKAAQADMNDLDAEVLKELDGLYRQAADEIERQIHAYGGADGNITLQNLQDVLGQVNARLGAISRQRDILLNDGMGSAARLGVEPFTPGATGGMAAVDSAAAMKISHEAVQFVRTFVAEDGLQLSDRIWRIDRGARDKVTNAIEMAVIQGHGAAQAAREFLTQGKPVPVEIQDKLSAANSARVAKDAAGHLLTGSGSPMDNAMRLFRTELNRAHGTAYMRGAEAHPDAVGTRFLLSPGHPKPDICNLHAVANLHGLGPGVYPTGKSPWPAHPNTLSYVVVVFKDEVTAADRAGKETPVQALARLSPEQRVGVLGVKKSEAFDEGKIKQGMIKAPWRAVKNRITPGAPPIPKVPLAKVKEDIHLDDMIAAGRIRSESLIQVATLENGQIRADAFIQTLHEQLHAERGVMTAAKMANSGKATELLTAASKMFPDDWTKQADSYGRLFTTFSKSRGWQITYPKEMDGAVRKVTNFGVRHIKGGDGFIRTGSFSTTIHEYAHRLQHALPKLDDYFQDLHQRRTAGDPAKRLKDLFPGQGYAKHEVTREDKYIHPYQGRSYQGLNVTYTGKHGALEVMTMAFENVLGGSSINLNKLVEHDREMLDLVIGLLFKYVP